MFGTLYEQVRENTDKIHTKKATLKKYENLEDAFKTM